jgi:hypothetical protein
MSPAKAVFRQTSVFRKFVCAQQRNRGDIKKEKVT